MPFTRQPQCAKCLGQMVAFHYIRAGFHMEHAGGCVQSYGDAGEHIDVTCRDCGWVWGMEIASER